MGWIRLDQNFVTHPKVAGLSNSAFRLWIHGIAFSNQHGLDGSIPKASLRHVAVMLKGRSRYAEELVRARLWHDDGDNWAIHDYLDYQPSASVIADIKEKRRIAGQKGGLAKASKTLASREAHPPVPPDPPVPPVPPTPASAVCTHIEDLPDNTEISGHVVEQYGEKYGRLGGLDFAKVAQLCPIRAWEMRAALDSWPEKWGGFVDCIVKIREESSKPKPPKAGDKPKKKDIFHEEHW